MLTELTPAEALGFLVTLTLSTYLSLRLLFRSP